MIIEDINSCGIVEKLFTEILLIFEFNNRLDGSYDSNQIVLARKAYWGSRFEPGAIEGVMDVFIRKIIMIMDAVTYCF